jgi:hypothetical protein
MGIDRRIVERAEETQALNVIHVKMSEKDVDSTGIRLNLFSQSADAGAGVENEQRSIVFAYLYGRGVPPVAHRIGPRNRH